MVELLVVIAIIAIMSGVVAVNFRKGSEGSKLQRAAQQIVQDIRKAQNMALSSVEYEGEVHDYYGVHFDKRILPSGNPGPHAYYIFVSNNILYNNDEEIGEAIELEKGIKIDSITTGNILDITFEPPYSYVEFNPSVDDATITIKKEDGTCPQDCRYIKINDKGWMSIKTVP